MVESVLTGPGPVRVVVARSVLVPVVSMRRLVKVAVPAMAVLVTVPWRVPVPVWIARVMLVVESAPVVMVLP